MWISVAIGLVIAVGLIVLALIRRSTRSPGSELSSEQWIALGIVFMAVGAGTMSTLGNAMIGVIVVGVLFLGRGMNAKRSDS